MARVLFRLTMPGVGSWNGQWSGEGGNYVIVRRLSADEAAKLDGRRWHHNFGDGWAASVSARVMEKGERKPKSDGFYGYDWMVENIIRWDTTECQHEWRLIEDDHTYGHGDWYMCRYCSSVTSNPRHVEAS